jgi:hypothetical protein
MYYIVPVKDGIMDLDYDFLEYSHIMADAAYVKMRPGYEERDSWTGMTEDEFLEFFGAARLSADKTEISADGVDAANIEALTPTLAEVSFYNIDTGELIAALPAANSKAVLQVASASPGRLRVRAGQRLMFSNVNVCEVTAR